MRILLTGSSGRIGAFIARRLSVDHTVIGMDLKAAPQTTVVGSILNKELVRDLCSQVDVVVHTASLHAPQIGIVPDAEFRKTNITGHEILLQSCLMTNVKRFVYTSTTSLYGEALVPKDKAVWITEAVKPEPRDIYDETKIAAENMCVEASREGLPCISLRMSRCFPEPEHLMAIYRLYRGVDGRDVAEAHALAVAAKATGYQVYNISARTPFTEADCPMLLEDAASVILKYYPWAREEFVKHVWRLPTEIDRVYVIDKAVTELGYAPKYNFEALVRGNVP